VHVTDWSEFITALLALTGFVYFSEATVQSQNTYTLEILLGHILRFYIGLRNIKRFPQLVSG